MSVMLNVASANILANGRWFQVVASVNPAPAFGSFGQPDSLLSAGLPTLSNGATLRFLGTTANGCEWLPCNIADDYSRVGTGTLPVGGYWIAAILRAPSGAVIGHVDPIYFEIHTLGQVPVYGGQNTPVGVNTLPWNSAVEVYMSLPNGDINHLWLYRSNTFGPGYLSTVGGFALDRATYQNPAQPIPPFSLYWTAVYEIDPAHAVTRSVQALTASGPLGMMTDSYGNASAAFAGVPVTNGSLIEANGFTSPVLTPPGGGGAGGIAFYVSSSHGSDANTAAQAQDPATPWATVSRALAAAKAMANPQWIASRLLRGDTFPGESGLFLSTIGLDLDHPFLIEDYWHSYDGSPDPGTCPVILNPTTNGVNGFVIGAGAGQPYYRKAIVIRRVAVIDKLNRGGAGISGGVPIDGLVIDDCRIQGFGVNVGLQVIGGAPAGVSSVSGTNDVSRRGFINRSVIMDAVNTAGAHTQGIYLVGFTDFLIYDSPIVDNGWQNVAHTQSTIFSHNGYIQNTCGPVYVANCLVRHGGSAGIQLRPGGILSGNVFADNQFHANILGAGGAFTGNVCLTTHDITGGPAGGIGIWIAANHAYSQYGASGTAGVEVVGNIFVNLASGTTNSTPAWVRWELTTNGQPIGQVRSTRVRNNTTVNSGAPLVLGPQPTPTTNATLAVSRNLIDSGTVPSLVTSFPASPVDYAWLKSDHNGYRTTAVANQFIMAGNQTLGSFAALTGSERHSFNAAPVYANPGANLATYAASLGFASEQAWVDHLRNRPPGVWDATYDMANVRAYFAAAYRTVNLDVRFGPGDSDYFGAVAPIWM